MSKNSPSIRDVAQKAGVSVATVSNVLNGSRRVSDALRERVLAAVSALDYVVDPIARSMRSSRTMTVGVVVCDINCIFFAPLLKGIQNVMSAAGYNVNIYDTDYDSALERRYVRMMKTGAVDGIILTGASDGRDRDFCLRLRDMNGSRPVPLVCVENDYSDMGIDSVYIDNEQAAYTAVSHLTELGCRRIAHIGTLFTAARANGYRHALGDAGIPHDPLLEINGDFSAMSGRDAVQALLARGLRFDGIFAANDQMAVGAIRALHSARIRIPEDVKVVGFDNTFVASIVEPALTTVNVPIYQMGVAAANRLLTRIQSPEGDAASVRMNYELTIRRSTMSSARTDWEMEHW